MREITLDAIHLKKMQDELLDLLVEFDRICRQHDIRYFLSCGTLLGAVRHHGFIPWDNDVDVELLREDYEKLREVCSQGLEGNYFFQDHSTDLNYFWPYGKFMKKGTRYLRPFHDKLGQQDGICMDVFILDAMPASELPQRMLEYGTTLCRKMLWARVGVETLSVSPSWLFFRCLSVIEPSLALKTHQAIAACYRNEDVPCLGFFNTSFRTRRGYALKKEWYAERLEWAFCGHKFYIPAGYHEILYLKYADYMKLPPPEQRIGSSPAEYIRFSDGEELWGEGIQA